MPAGYTQQLFTDLLQMVIPFKLIVRRKLIDIHRKNTRNVLDLFPENKKYFAAPEYHFEWIWIHSYNTILKDGFFSSGSG